MFYKAILANEPTSMTCTSVTFRIVVCCITIHEFDSKQQTIQYSGVGTVAAIVALAATLFMPYNIVIFIT